MQNLYCSIVLIFQFLMLKADYYLLRLLIMYGADVNSVDDRGKTPLDLGYEKIMKKGIEESGILMRLLWKKRAKFGKDVKTI